MPIDGVFPTPLPLPMGYEGAYSPDASRLAYVPLPRGFNAWKRYRGGMTTPIWISNLSDSSVEKLPRTNSNDFNPMWSGNKIYFLSDRSGPITLFSYDTASKKVDQLIRNEGLDIKSASIGEDGIVYEQFGSLNLYDWINQVRNGDANARRNVTISLLSEDLSAAVLTWKLLRAWPVKYSFADLNAKGTDVAIEELVLAYERLEME